jgi:hypothetical protein
LLTASENLFDPSENVLTATENLLDPSKNLLTATENLFTAIEKPYISRENSGINNIFTLIKTMFQTIDDYIQEGARVWGMRFLRIFLYIWALVST